MRYNGQLNALRFALLGARFWGCLGPSLMRAFWRRRGADRPATLQTHLSALAAPGRHDDRWLEREHLRAQRPGLIVYLALLNAARLRKHPAERWVNRNRAIGAGLKVPQPKYLLAQE